MQNYENDSYEHLMETAANLQICDKITATTVNKSKYICC